MTQQSAIYSQHQAEKANLSLPSLGLDSWSAADVRALQVKVGAKPTDGWFGPKSLKKWKAWKRKHEPQPVPRPAPSAFGYLPGQAIINGKGFTPPAELRLINHAQKGGIPAQINDTSKRKREPTQFVFHRGYSGPYKVGRNFAAKTEAVLDARGLSTSFSMDIDGTIYQHFDVGTRRGRHATHHNVQSDSLDIGGPFSLKYKGAPGQKKLNIKMAIGRKNDHKPPLSRKYASVKCWSLTPEQAVALILFVPWWCELRGIPLTACEDWRTFRIGGVGRKDPVTNVTGLLAHTQISGPGQRVDGILPLMALKKATSTGIEWRTGEEFFNT